MNISVQQLLVTLVMLVPGFIATNIQRTFVPRRFSSDFHWTVTSLLLSIFLNLVLGMAFMLFVVGKDALVISIGKAAAQLEAISMQTTFSYVAVLYLSAVVYGMVLGIFPGFRLRAILNRWHVITFAEHPSVWDRVFAIRQPHDRPISWVRINVDEGRTIVGHLRHSSEHIDKDAAFEIYLDEPYEWCDDRWKPVGSDLVKEGADGIYLRLQVSQPAVLFFRDSTWRPNIRAEADEVE